MMILPQRAALHLKGAESRAFLHHITTQNFLDLKSGEARFGALLSPQGKILFDFIGLGREDGVTLDLPLARLDVAMARFKLYLLRAKIALEDHSRDWRIAVSSTPKTDFYSDPRNERLPWRGIVLEDSPAGDAFWDAQRIALTVAEGGRDFLYEETFPHEANMDRLHGIDFKKGCYIGQEVVARMEHRGLARARIVSVQFEGAPPSEGADLVDGSGRVIGRMGSSDAAAHKGLALARLDRIAEAKGEGFVKAQPIQLHSELLG